MHRRVHDELVVIHLRRQCTVQIHMDVRFLVGADDVVVALAALVFRQSLFHRHRHLIDHPTRPLMTAAVVAVVRRGAIAAGVVHRGAIAAGVVHRGVIAAGVVHPGVVAAVAVAAAVGAVVVTVVAVVRAEVALASSHRTE